MEPPKAERYEITSLSLELAKAFQKRTEGHRLEALFTVCLAFGVRMGEALGLKREDIDFERHKLTLGRALQRQKGKGLVEIPPRSEPGDRCAPKQIIDRYAPRNTGAKSAGSRVQGA